jgi:ABC-type antimicrobial peptide transport system permease subunit
MTAIVRLSAAGPGIGALLREAAQAVGPRVLIERIRTADEMFGELVITPRRQAALLGLLGALGLTLALVGVFGMTAYAVARRTGEIGVRMAFGARADQVVGTILRDSAPPIAAGVLFGVGGAVMTTRVIESFLFETAPRDPLTLAVVAVTLAAAGCLAALVPALRAVKVDPVACLRAE